MESLNEGAEELGTADEPVAVLAGDADGLLLSAETLTRLLADTGHWVWVFDVVHQVADVTPDWLRFTGQTADEIHQYGWLQTIHPSDRTQVSQAWDDSAEQQTRFAVHARLKRADGVYQWFEIQGIPEIGPSGAVVRWVGYARDIDEQVQLEDQARRQAVRLGALEQAGTVGIVVANATNVLEANDAFLRMLGYTREDLEAGLMDWPAMTPPEFAAIDEQAFTQIVELGACAPYQKEFWRKDGSRVSILGSAALLNQDPPVVIAIVVDMTEVKELEREREQMLHIVGHELRTPLTSLKARMQLLQRRLIKSEPTDATLAAKALEDVSRIQRLVDDLNEGAQLERGALDLRRHVTDLVELCRECVADIERATGRAIDGVFPVNPIMVDVDADRIRQVLTNLVNNAVKYTPPEAVVEVLVALTKTRDHAQIRVRDTGPGIPPEALLHLFERFFQVQGAQVFASGSPIGTGLGLYIAKAVVEAHQGEITVESKVGKGTAFTVTLPCANA